MACKPGGSSKSLETHADYRGNAEDRAGSPMTAESKMPFVFVWSVHVSMSDLSAPAKHVAGLS